MKVYACNGITKGQLLGYHWLTENPIFSDGEAVIYRTTSGRVIPADEAKKHEIAIHKDFLYPVFHSRQEISDWLTKTVRLRNADKLYRDLYNNLGQDLPAMLERKVFHPGAKPVNDLINDLKK